MVTQREKPAVSARKKKPASDPEFDAFLSRLRAAATKKGIASGHGFQTDLERVSGVDQSQMSRMFAKKRWPSRATVARLAAALQVPPGWLLFGESELQRLGIGLEGPATLDDLVTVLLRRIGEQKSGPGDTVNVSKTPDVDPSKTKT